MSLPNFFDTSWTLFLDRDGVINRRIVDSYVMSPSEFEFLPGVIDSMTYLSTVFSRIIVVTNQQGIGKGLMTHDDLHSIHSKMIRTVTLHGGRIDNVYYCPNLAHENPLCRKPNPGMALQAQKDYPEIDFKTSIMVGDSVSDIQFGNQLGMYTVRIAKKSDERANLTCNSLSDWVTYIM